ncbi:hypothetical protein T05_7190 [Trichinella murrelli]|uniref:Uncharacterized protein n=1 Tax=Trichinella murrelli TaxID=144512 RepID=A0A0V0UAA3_9BILA|nr:hypothetical protein T05_7190 [Trichinella murrelli]
MNIKNEITAHLARYGDSLYFDWILNAKSFLNFQIVLSLLVEFSSAFLLFIFQRGLAKSSNALKTGFQRCIMQITIAITRLIISKGAFVCLIYVPISSIVERSLSSLRALSLKNGAKKM